MKTKEINHPSAPGLVKKQNKIKKTAQWREFLGFIF